MKRLLQLISLTFTLISTFLGVIYWKGGEYLIIAIGSSLFFTIIFFFIIDMLIKNKENIKKRKFSPLSIFLWFSFLLFSMISSIIILHGLNVQFNAKQDIQKESLHKLDLLESMTREYKKSVEKDCSSYSTNLDTLLNKYILEKDNAKIYNILISDPYHIDKKTLSKINSENIRFKNKIRDTRTKSLEKRFNKEIQDVTFKTDKYLRNNTNSIKRWHILEMNTIFYTLDNLLKNNFQQLENSFNKHKSNKLSKFSYNIPEENIPLNDPLALWEKYTPNYLLIILASFYLLLLTPYLIHGDKKRRYKEQTIKLEGGVEL